MHRTTVMLPAKLRNRARAFASKKGISVGELIRESLEDTLNKSKDTSKTDPFFADTNFYGGDAPIDLSTGHDEHLYDYFH